MRPARVPTIRRARGTSFPRYAAQPDERHRSVITIRVHPMYGYGVNPSYVSYGGFGAYNPYAVARRRAALALAVERQREQLMLLRERMSEQVQLAQLQAQYGYAGLGAPGFGVPAAYSAALPYGTYGFGSYGFGC
jgi:hypothetical protein